MRFLDRGGDPAARTQRDLEAKLKGKIDQRVDNAVRLQTAETKLAEARSNVEALALEADDAALDRALQARRGAEDKLAALHGAALAIGKEISDIEAAIDKVVDQRVRHETSQAVDAMNTRLSKAASAFDEAAKELEAAAREILIIPEAQAVAEFTKSMHVQIPVAVQMITGALKQHARAVVEGHAPPSLPRRAAPAPVLTVVPQEPMVNVFVTRNIRYVAQGGDVVCCGRNRRHDLPARIAELALAAKAAVPLTDRKRIDAYDGVSGQLEPTPSSCEWLGERGREIPPPQMRPGGGPPIHSSLVQFEVHPDYIDAKPIVGTMPAPPLVVGARNLPDDEV
jgi:hypothetical protein